MLSRLIKAREKKRVRMSYGNNKHRRNLKQHKIKEENQHWKIQ